MKVRAPANEKLTKLASVATLLKHVYAVIKERARVEKKIQWLHLSHDQLAELDQILGAHPQIASQINASINHPNFDDILLLSSQLQTLTRYLTWQRFVDAFEKGEITPEELSELELFRTHESLDDYLKVKAEKEKLYQQWRLELSVIEKAKLSIFDVLFIRKYFSAAHERSQQNLQDVLALSKDDRLKLQAIYPPYLDLFFFTPNKMNLSELMSLNSDAKRFINNALLTNNTDILNQIRAGQFKEVYRNATSEAIAHEVTPLLDFDTKVSALINGLLIKLEKYLKRIEEHRNPANFLHPDFTYGFKYFIDSQANNRRANYCLVKELCQELKKDDVNLMNLFTRKEIRRLRYKEGAPSYNHGINSRDISEVLSEARWFIWDNRKALRAQVDVKLRLSINTS